MTRKPDGHAAAAGLRLRTLTRRRRISRAIAEMHYELRTENDSPWRQAFSVWLGVFVGCTPLYGLQTPLCFGLAKLLGLSRIKSFLAAHVNNPLTFPFLLYAEFGIGRWLVTGSWPALRLGEVLSQSPLALGRDLAVGSLVLGALLGTLLGGASYVISSRWREAPASVRLAEAISRRYVRAGILHWELVRAALRRDPIYRRLLSWEVLPEAGRLVHLGCGRGLLLALLDTSRELHARGEWPEGRAAPPRGLELHGVEPRRRLAAVARTALGDQASIQVRHLARYEPLPCRAAILLDVLHRLPADEQELLIGRLGRAVEPGGLVIVREPDADRGLRFAAARWVRRLAALLHRQAGPARYRSLRSWIALLEAHGFATESRPLPRATALADVVILGRKLGPNELPRG